MRIALLADVHGNLPALEAVLADIAFRDVDQLVTLGDHVSGPLLPAETAATMMGRPWLQIAGNHERQLLSSDSAHLGLSDRYTHQCLSQEHLAWLRGLPPTARFGADVYLCHGSPRSDCEFLLETVEPGRVRPATAPEIAERLAGVSQAAVVCGHSHLPGIGRTESGQLLVNPGSVGLPAYSDTRADSVYFAIENDSPDARYALLENRRDAWNAALCRVTYDFEPMAKLAERNGRPEWACALRTGRVLPTDT